MAFMNNQPADSAIGCSEIILMAARNIRVFDGRIHMCMEMAELFIPNNLEKIVRCYIVYHPTRSPSPGFMHPTEIRFPIGRERVTYRRLKLTKTQAKQ